MQNRHLRFDKPLDMCPPKGLARWRLLLARYRERKFSRANLCLRQQFDIQSRFYQQASNKFSKYNLFLKPVPAYKKFQTAQTGFLRRKCPCCFAQKQLELRLKSFAFYLQNMNFGCFQALKTGPFPQKKD